MVGSTPYDMGGDRGAEDQLDLAEDDSLPWLEAAEDEDHAAGFDTSRLILLGGVRELLATGGLLGNMDLLFGPAAAHWQLQLPGVDGGLLLAALPPGAFIIAGLLLASGQALRAHRRSGEASNNRD